MITNRQYKKLLKKYGFEVEFETTGYIKNDEYIGENGRWNQISEWFCEGDILIYDRITIKKNKIVFEFKSVLCSSPKEFENKLQNLIKNIKNMKKQIKLAKMEKDFV